MSKKKEKKKQNLLLNIFVVARFLWPKFGISGPKHKAQLTIDICRGWVKELSLSEPVRSDTWTTLLQKIKTQEWISHL